MKLAAGPAGPHAAFCNHSQTISDIVDHLLTRVLDQFGIASPAANRWAGPAAAQRTAARRAPGEAAADEKETDITRQVDTCHT